MNDWSWCASFSANRNVKRAGHAGKRMPLLQEQLDMIDVVLSQWKLRGGVARSLKCMKRWRGAPVKSARRLLGDANKYKTSCHLNYYSGETVLKQVRFVFVLSKPITVKILLVKVTFLEYIYLKKLNDLIYYDSITRPQSYMTNVKFSFTKGFIDI